ADEVEAEIERLIAAGAPAPAAVGRVRSLENALDDYLRELASAFDLDLAGRRIVLDCANGATHRAAPRAFERLGAEVETIAAEPGRRPQRRRRPRRARLEARGRAVGPSDLDRGGADRRRNRRRAAGDERPRRPRPRRRDPDAKAPPEPDQRPRRQRRGRRRDP